MKKTLFATLALVVFSALVLAQTNTPDQEATKAVLKLCNEWDDAYIKKDAAPFEKMLTADYVGIDEEGAVTTKQDEIDLIKSGEYVIFSVEHLEPQKVRVYGSGAVVTSYARVKHSSKGETSTVVGRATTVCVKQDSQWKIASWHASRLKE